MSEKYVDDAEFRRELDAWRGSAEDPALRTPSERLGQILDALHDGVLRHKCFNRYRPEVKEEMKSWSVYRILKTGLASYDFQRSPFSYFTRAVFMNYANVLRAYYRRLNRHRKYVRDALEQMAAIGFRKGPGPEEA